jgi:hypothetical protein
LPAGVEILQWHILKLTLQVVDFVGTTFVNIFDQLIKNSANLLKNVRKQYPSDELKVIPDSVYV